MTTDHSQVIAAVAPGSDLAEMRRSNFDFVRQQLAAPLGQQLESLFGPGAAAPLRVAINDAEAAASLVDQLPSVLAAVSRGTSEFTPTPAEVKELLGRAYPAGRAPLIVQFEVDGLDESPALAAALPASARATPLVLPGTHLTPLVVDPDAPTSALLPLPALGGGGAALRAALLADADKLIDAIDGHFDKVAAEQLSAAAAAEWEASQIQPPKAAAAEVEAAPAAAAVAEAAAEAEAVAEARAAEAAEADAADAAAEAAKAEEAQAKAAKAEEVKAEALVAEARAAEAAAARLAEEEAMAEMIATAKADAMAQAEGEAAAEMAATVKAKAVAKEVRLATEEARLKAEAEARAADAEVVAAEASVAEAEAVAEAATAAATAATTVVAAPAATEGVASEGAANYRELKVPAGKKKKKTRKKKASAD